MDKKFITLISIPALIILGLIMFKLIPLMIGKEIILKAQPIDPTDLFRGNYVLLNYEISRINLDSVSHDKILYSKDEEIYATLIQHGDYWRINSISQMKSLFNIKRSCLKGTIISVNNKEIIVEWGIESFFSSPEKTKAIEISAWRNQIYAIVTADSFCNSVLRYIKVGNETIKNS